MTVQRLQISCIGQFGPGSQTFQELGVAEDGLKIDRGTIGVQPGKVHLTAFDDGSEIEAGLMLEFLAETYSMALHFDTPRRFRVPKPIAECVECETESSQQFSA